MAPTAPDYWTPLQQSWGVRELRPSMIVQRHVFHSDLGEAGGARLLSWCRRHGADSLTFTVIGSPPDLEQQAAAIEAPLGSFRLEPTRIQVIPEGEPGSYWTKLSVSGNSTTPRRRRSFRSFRRVFSPTFPRAALGAKIRAYFVVRSLCSV